MFFAILSRELHEAFTSFTLLSILGVMAVLVPLTAYAQAARYQAVIGDHAQRRAVFERQNNPEVMTISRAVPELLPVSNGTFFNSPAGIILLGATATRSSASEDQRPLDWLFSSVDLTRIIGIFMSLMVIILSHDTITRERERGTLKLLLAGAVPRRTVLAGKLAAIHALVAVILLTATLLYVLSLRLFGAGLLDTLSKHPGELGMLTVCALLTLSTYAALGTFISTCVRQSALALTLAVAAWVTTVLIWPSVVPHLAVSLRPVASKQYAQREIHAAQVSLVDSEREELLRSARELTTRGAGVEEAWGKYVEIKRRWLQRKREELEGLTQQREQQLRSQQSIAASLLLASPYGAFSEMANTLCETGLEEYRRFTDGVRRYQSDTFAPVSFKAFSASEPWKGIPEKPAAFDVPGFSLPPLALEAKLDAVARPAGILVAATTLLIVISFLKFDRYDVR